MLSFVSFGSGKQKMKRLNQFRRPLVLGIDQDACTSTMALPDRLAAYGNNTGNLLFGEALYQVVDNARRASYHFENEQIEEADVVVIAAANWVSRHSDFGWLARRLKSFGRPVVLIGIGVQVEEGGHPAVSDGTRMLLDLASETSSSISVRGEETAEALSELGYSNVVTTGCPSLLLSGGKISDGIAPPEPSVTNTCLMATRHLFDQSASKQREIYSLAYQCRFDILLQSELADMYFALDQQRSDHIIDVSNKVLADAYGTSNIPSIRTYLREKGKVFFSAQDWRNYLQTIDFVVGTRIHGTIAAVLSGKLGFLLCHDVRTAELAKSMGIPHAMLSSLPSITAENIFDAIRSADFTVTRQKYLKYEANFREFFRSNGLKLRVPKRMFGC